MNFLESIILGILQGVAEFLPISSSGHLAIAQYFLGVEEVPIVYDILLHVASLVVVLFYFRKLIIRLFAVLFRFFTRKQKSDDKNDLFMILAVIIATVITCVGYLGLKLLFDEKIDNAKQNIFFVGIFFVVTGIILILQRFFHVKPKGDKITPLQAAIVGTSQIFALLPGISRSGATISAGVFSGVDKERAGELSFLISIPAILGSLVFKLDEVKDSFGSGAGDISVWVLIVGMVSALLAGMVAFPLFLKILKKERLWYFSFYLIPFGIFIALFSYFCK